MKATPKDISDFLNYWSGKIYRIQNTRTPMWALPLEQNLTRTTTAYALMDFEIEGKEEIISAIMGFIADEYKTTKAFRDYIEREYMNWLITKQ